MQQFFDYIGLVLNGLATALNLPFQLFGITATVASLMPQFLGMIVILICSVGISKLIVGWI